MESDLRHNTAIGTVNVLLLFTVILLHTEVKIVDVETAQFSNLDLNEQTHKMSDCGIYHVPI